MIELIRQKRVKDKFRREFGSSIDDFFAHEDDRPSDDSLKTDILGQTPTASDGAQLNDDLLLARLEEANQVLDEGADKKDELALKEHRARVQQILLRLEEEIKQNKFEDVLTPAQAQDRAMQVLTPDDEKFVEQVDQEYYTRVRSSEEYYRRKRLILASLDRL